ncbi:SAM-dependent methyltransferase [Saccharopolyspora subtropica]|uniref:Mycofactocin oligosaccharide methyltransferase MftM n=1 Tax=Saccharopolyspora thermophila TaxID=89367 RepID=A0A917K712_9PSEU|nr:mycofactocin oligosaccharide methyltransferase MftM [Saccharopolyspora subtropica]GGJ03335.1 SAM-dependent methyltransferase [Saccharopolyspora subtropica]
MSVPDPATEVQVIDPLAPVSADRSADRLVEVVRRSAPPDEGCGQVTRTRHFCLHRRDHRVEITHWLRPEQLDNDLAGILAEELFAPGWLSGAETFEQVFTEVVRSMADDPLLAWMAFYDNTLNRIRKCWARTAVESSPSSIGGFAPVYRRALRLVTPGRVLDLGSCFGFLPILLAERGRNTVIASDLAPGSMRLLEAVAGARGQRLRTLVCDATRVPLPDRSVDTVTAVHLLEHMDAEQGDAVLAEALRLARRRIVVAVPFEDEPTAAYGHVRTFTRADLDELGRATQCRYEVSEHHGGWLVVHPR